MKKKPAPDVTCIGELLIDFVAGESATLADATQFMKCAGGAPANVAVGIARLGARSAFIGKVGNDPFGKFLEREMAVACVDTSGIRFDDEHNTRLAFVSLTKSGERDFAFWEKHPADEYLDPDDIDMDRLAESKIVHISSFLLLREPVRSTALEVARRLHADEVAVSFDPNIRLPLWGSKKAAQTALSGMLKYCTVLRLNEDEAYLLSGCRTIISAAKRLLECGTKVVVVTHGADGCTVFTDRFSFSLDGFKVKALDTTGCGDGFLAGLLYGLVQSGQPVEELRREKLSESCRVANAVGALTATKYGVIPALPTLAEVRKFLAGVQQ